MICLLALLQADFTRPLFEDDFSGETLGKAWKLYKSASVIRDGVLVGIEPPDAGHDAVNAVEIPPVGDVLVELSFKLEGAKRFGVAFDDKAYKGSHAGHICRVLFDAAGFTYRDDRDGIFKNETWEKKRKGEKVDLAGRSLAVKRAFVPGTWYALSPRIEGDTMRAAIDGVPAEPFRASGVAHAEKRAVALVVSGREAHVDHLKIRSTP